MEMTQAFLNVTREMNGLRPLSVEEYLAFMEGTKGWPDQLRKLVCEIKKETINDRRPT